MNDSKPVQPTIVARKASILEVDGLQFKDLNGNGGLDPTKTGGGRSRSGSTTCSRR